MNTKKTALLYALLALVSSERAAASTSKNSGTTVVTISGQKVIQLSDTGKKIQKKLQNEQDALAKPLQKDENTIRTKEKELQDKKRKLDKEAEEISTSKILSQDAKQRKYEELQDQVRILEEDKAELDRLVKRLQTDAKRVEAKMSQMYQEEMTEFDKKIKSLIEEVADREGWDIVLMEESVVYASSKVSKTDAIIKEIDGRENKKRKGDSITTLEKKVEKDLKTLASEL